MGVSALSTKPVVFVTRRLPEAVEARLERDYEVRWNATDAVLEGDALVDGANGADGILTCPTERWTAAMLEALPASIRIMATFSVGHDHIDVAAARRAGIIVTNTPDVLTEATADIAMLCLLAASRRVARASR